MADDANSKEESSSLASYIEARKSLFELEWRECQSLIVLKIVGVLFALVSGIGLIAVYCSAIHHSAFGLSELLLCQASLAETVWLYVIAYALQLAWHASVVMFSIKCLVMQKRSLFELSIAECKADLEKLQELIPFKQKNES